MSLPPTFHALPESIEPAFERQLQKLRLATKNHLMHRDQSTPRIASDSELVIVIEVISLLVEKFLYFYGPDVRVERMASNQHTSCSQQVVQPSHARVGMRIEAR